MQSRTASLILILWVVCVCGCAASHVYSINMYYDAERFNIPDFAKAGGAVSGTRIAVAELNDLRNMDDQLSVGWVVERDGMKTLIFPKNVRAARAVAIGITQYLKKAGYQVLPKIEQWNANEGTLPDTEGKILIGGNIEKLDMFCRKGFPTHSYNAHIKLTVAIADMKTGKVLYKRRIESRYAQEHVAFSENILGEQASLALTETIEKIFEDRTVMQKIRQMLAK